MEFLTAASSWLCLGVKLSKLPQLRKTWKYMVKQKHKIVPGITDASSTNDVVCWLRDEIGNEHLSRHFEGDGMAVRDLLCSGSMDSDSALEALGIDSEVERGRVIYLIRRSRHSARARPLGLADGQLMAQVVSSGGRAADQKE